MPDPRAPLPAGRAEARGVAEARRALCIEVADHRPLDLAMRGRKGPYENARAGELPPCTGISDPSGHRLTPGSVVGTAAADLRTSTQAFLRS